jgi:hypothetical protein
MALFGQARDISMFRYINRELMQNIISQQVVFYKYKVAETKVNMYGESSEGRNFVDPVILFALIETSNFNYPVSDLGVDFNWSVTYKFLRDDLVDNNVYPEIGDIIMFQNGYWEIDNVNTTQFFVGKDPEYPYLDAAGNNPYETDLGQFGYNVSVICTSHYVPSDRLNIELSRL